MASHKWLKGTTKLILLYILNLVSLRCTRIDGASDNPPKWIPSPIIKPIMEFVKTLFCQEPSGPVIEIPANKKQETLLNRCLDAGALQ